MLPVDVLTTARADFSMIAPVVDQMMSDARLAPRLIVTGAHFSANEAPGIEKLRSSVEAASVTVPCHGIGVDAANSARAMAAMVEGFATLWSESRPCACVLLGDRFELLPAASVAVLYGIPIVHLFGGEEDVAYCFDTQVRNGITKMAHLHLVMHEAHRERLLAMGEEAWRIQVCGNPAVDSLGDDSDAFAEWSRDVGLSGIPLIAACYLPPTTVRGRWPAELDALLAALDDYPTHGIVWAGVNADPDSLAIEKRLRAHSAAHPNHVFAANLGRERYFGLLRTADVLVGNSSSGLLEAASFGLPVVNVGVRQTGRLCGDNVLIVPGERANIADALRTAFSDGAFRNRAHTATNPFYREDSARLIVEAVADLTAMPTDKVMLKRTVKGNPGKVGELNRVPEYGTACG